MNKNKFYVIEKLKDNFKHHIYFTFNKQQIVLTQTVNG